MSTSEDKKRIAGILDRFFVREWEQQKKDKKPKPRNKKPEDIVVKSITDWCKEKGFFMQRFESKAKRIVTNSGKVMFRTTGLEVGTPDLLGCTNWGTICAIEVKAPGCRSTLRSEQREFLEQVIHRFGFGVCSDNATKLNKIYYNWYPMRAEARREYLLDELPKEIQKRVTSFDPS